MRFVRRGMLRSPTFRVDWRIMMDLEITVGIIVAVLDGILGLIVTALKLAGKTSIPDLLRGSGSDETHPPLVPATPPASGEATPWLGRP